MKAKGRGKTLLSVQVVAARLDCSVSHVYRLIAAGELVACRIGKRKGYRVEMKKLDEFLKKNAFS